MEPTIAAPEEALERVSSTALQERESKRTDATWWQRMRQSRRFALLTNAPSQVFVATVAFYLLLTCLHLWLSSTPAGQAQPAGLTGWGEAALTAWRRFDTDYFLKIAHRGYTNQNIGAFFPLYPLLIWLAAWPLGGHFTLAALTVSWACAWGSYQWFYRLAEREYGAQTARLALLFLAVCPMGLFSFAGYSESLFLLVSIGAVERARAGRFWQAGALGALAMLCRPTGILLLLPLGWELARRSGWWRNARNLPIVRRRGAGLGWLSLALIPLALAGYMLFLKAATGNALAFLHGENAWNRHLTAPWETAGLFALAFQHAWQAGDATVFLGNIIDLLLTVPLPLLVLYLSIRRQSIWFGAALYQLALTLMLVAIPIHPTAQGPYEIFFSTQRFMLPAFPLFLLLGRLGVAHPRLYRVLLVASIVLLAFNTLQFLNNSFVA